MTGLRVISGKAKGRRLKSVPGDSTRPITDRTKESLFNILGVNVQGANFLDLFGGTGSVGIEALSRGAGFVRFVDNNGHAIKTINDNLHLTGFDRNAEVKYGDAFKILQNSPDTRFDYIYIAPPQYKEIAGRVLYYLDEHIDWISESGWVIIQIHPVEYKTLLKGGQLQRLVEFDQRKYGSTLLVFYRLAH